MKWCKGTSGSEVATTVVVAVHSCGCIKVLGEEEEEEKRGEANEEEHTYDSCAVYILHLQAQSLPENTCAWGMILVGEGSVLLHVPSDLMECDWRGTVVKFEHTNHIITVLKQFF